MFIKSGPGPVPRDIVIPLVGRLPDIGDTRLQVLAQQANMTERTLARCCLKELGMSLNEWRQRLKVIKAMSMLTAGKKVESIALDLGYANASAFINMFKRWMNLTPDQFRKLNQP